VLHAQTFLLQVCCRQLRQLTEIDVSTQQRYTGDRRHETIRWLGNDGIGELGIAIAQDAPTQDFPFFASNVDISGTPIRFGGTPPIAPSYLTEPAAVGADASIVTGCPDIASRVRARPTRCIKPQYD
jgi:hypothetical protein